MRKLFALILAGVMGMTFISCTNTSEVESDESPAGENIDGIAVAETYTYALAEGEETVVADTVFEGDVTVSGDNAVITFVNCKFGGNVVNTASEGTRVVIVGESEVGGQLVFDNDVKEATIETSLPKFIVDTNADVVCEDCVGTVVAAGDYEITFNGEKYRIADAELYYDADNPDAGFVAYEGQEANILIVAQWWENGEKVMFIECEYEPAE